jgi:hypothetical protein
MKFKNILILENEGCDGSKCSGGWTTITAQQYDTYKSDPTLQVCYEGPGKNYKFCKLKTNNNVTPTPSPGNNCVQPEECPSNVQDFLTWYWKDKKWVDANGNPDTKSYQDEINGVDLDAKKCVTKKYSKNYEGAKAKYTNNKCVAGPTGTEGLKIAYSKTKDRYLVTPSPTIIDDPDAKAREECKNKGGVYNESTKNCDMPLKPGVQDFRIEFDTKFGGLVDKFELNPEQWDRMYDTMPETYPPTSFSVLSSITQNIVSYIGKYYASSEFGIFKQVLDTFVELYGNKVDDEGTVTEDKSKILDPSFFKRFGGTVEQVKGLSNSISSKNNEVKELVNYDFLSDPNDQLGMLFQEVIVTVLETPESYFTKPLKMKAFRFTKQGVIPTIDTKPITDVINGQLNELNCLAVLDTYGKYRANIYITDDLMRKLLKLGQKCLCSNFYKDLGKLSIKDKFDKEKRNLVKKRLATYNTMNISINNC